jgi:uncharacterized protein YqgC (DUF456 family)
VEAESFNGWLILQWLAYVVIGSGVIGAMLPVLPGPMLIWLGALLWAWADHFQRVGWPTLTILALLGIVGGGAEYWMSALGARKGGASWQGLLAGIILGLVGFVVFSLLGAIVGVLLGILAVETWRAGGLKPALKSSGGFLIGYVLSSAVQVSLSLIMVAVFAWQATSPP